MSLIAHLTQDIPTPERHGDIERATSNLLGERQTDIFLGDKKRDETRLKKLNKLKTTP